MVAGVALAIARHLRVDPLLVRIAFVVAVTVGGAGVAAYLAAWLLVPEEGREQPVLTLGAGRRAGGILGAVLLVAGACAFLDAVGASLASNIVWASLLAAAGAWLLLARSPHSPAMSHDSAATSATAMPPAATHDPEQATTTMAATEAPRSSRATRVVGGAMLLAAGGVAAAAAAGAAFGWVTAAGVLVLASGAVLIAGAFFGASAWLTLPPLALAAVVAGLGAADVELRGPVGERTYAPTAAAALPDTNRMAIGELEVDLRDLELPPGTTHLKVRLGIGDAEVHLPADVPVRLDAHAGAGELRLPGGDADGTAVDRSEQFGAGGPRLLVLDARVGLGELHVTRAGDAG
jgi:phage shock protein PspC (stress-responsive transcriptional regulator)